MSNQLAPVQWRKGQILQPAHLEAQELALLTNTKLRVDGLGKPYFGLLQLSFDESDVMESGLRVRVLSYVLKSGELIQLGGNAKWLFSEGLVKLPKDKNRADIRLNIYQSNEEQDGYLALNESLQAESQSVEVSRRCYYLELFTYPQVSGKDTPNLTPSMRLVAQVKLAEYVLDRQHNWAVYEQYIPPTIQANRTPAFEPYLAKFKLYFDAFAQELEASIMPGHIETMPTINSQKFALLSQLYEAIQHIEAWHDIEADISTHPYDVFARVKSLYSQVELYRHCQRLRLDEIDENTEHPQAPVTEEAHRQNQAYGAGYLRNSVSSAFRRSRWQQFVYRHEDLGNTFYHLLEAIKRVIYRKSFDYQIKKLTEKDGIYSADIPLLNQANYYLAVWNEDQQLLDNFVPPQKATSRAQVPMLTLHNIPGLRFRQVDSSRIPRLEQALNPCMPAVYYEIDIQGEQWLQVKQDKNIGFYGQNALRSSQFFIVVETSHNEINA